MKTQLFSLLFLITIFISKAGISQDLVNQKIPFLPGNAYTISKQTWDLNQLTTEVFPSTSPADMIAYQEQLSRVFIVETNPALVESYANLSTITLKNKYYPNLTNDFDRFAINTFNPLKYFFNFYSPTQMNYRVDNTNYMIIIVPFPSN